MEPYGDTKLPHPTLQVEEGEMYTEGDTRMQNTATTASQVGARLRGSSKGMNFWRIIVEIILPPKVPPSRGFCVLLHACWWWHRR
mmetsp:Transcript_13746/g.22465  ORF Transcript_13746/g.22465 Transcript_13746/m.22465 type:complete len:85 (+) Transcript_13746:1471-1725(+)